MQRDGQILNDRFSAGQKENMKIGVLRPFMVYVKWTVNSQNNGHWFSKTFHAVHEVLLHDHKVRVWCA